MDTITKQLADALRDLQYATLMRPSCQAGHALRCLCSGCAEVRANKALAAYDAQPVQQARQPLPPSELAVAKRCAEIASATSYSAVAAQIIRAEFGITGEQPHG